MTDLASLQKRLEEATGPDRELDAAIALALGYVAGDAATPLLNLRRDEDDPEWLNYELLLEGKGELYTDRVAPLTASADAAIALVERKLPGAWYVIAKGRLSAAEPLYGCELLFNQDEQLGIASGHTQAAAICAALVRALQSQETR